MHWPFVPWPYQVQALRSMWQAVESGEDRLVEKSRDMGVSWMTLAVCAWYWLFTPEFTAKIMSRKEELVDRNDDPDCLFWKLDYLIARCPDWIRPTVTRGTHRTHLHLSNPRNGSVIDGESTNTDVGRGGRRKVLLIDEAAHVDTLATIMRATADTTPCRLLVSTPNGMNEFGRLRDEYQQDDRVITMHWSAHPEKAEGLTWVEGEDGQTRPTSPWYESECARRKSPRDIAQELDIDYLASGHMYFDAPVLQLIRAGEDLCPPQHRGNVEFQTDCTQEGIAYKVHGEQWGPMDGGPLSLWCDILADDDGTLRPPQDDNYVAFADIAHGLGASNSVLTVFSRTRREQVATWVSCETPPHVFANQTVALLRWFRGECGYVMLGFEANGPGGEYRRQLHRLHYPYVIGNPDLSLMWEPEAKSIGWTSTRESKAALLSDLRQQLAAREMTLHDSAVVTELEQYVFYASGSIGPASLSDVPGGGRAEHGDRVIALAGIPLMLKQAPPIKVKPRQYSSFSMAGRMSRAAASRERTHAW
jgi:hypothetical protein